MSSVLLCGATVRQQPAASSRSRAKMRSSRINQVAQNKQDFRTYHQTQGHDADNDADPTCLPSSVADVAAADSGSAAF